MFSCKQFEWLEIDEMVDSLTEVAAAQHIVSSSTMEKSLKITALGFSILILRAYSKWERRTGVLIIPIIF
jgi:hypothetical protein